MLGGSFVEKKWLFIEKLSPKRCKMEYLYYLCTVEVCAYASVAFEVWHDNMANRGDN